MKKFNLNIKIVCLFVISFDNYLMSMTKRTVPVFKKFAMPKGALEPVKMNAVLYTDPVSLEYGQRQQRYIDSMNRQAMNLGSFSCGQSIVPQVEYVVFGGSDFDRPIDLVSRGVSDINILIRQVQELGRGLDVNDEELIEDVEFLSENKSLFDDLRLSDKLKSIKLEKPSDLKSFKQRIKQLRVDVVREIFKLLGIPDALMGNKDIVKFMNSKAMKSIQRFMSLKVCDAYKILNYDTLGVISKGIESDSVSVQYMTVRSFFFPVSNVGMPPFFSLYPLVLANAFAQGLCELLVGRPLTLEEFKAERVKYHILLNSLEKIITIVLSIVTVYVSVKFLKMVVSKDDYEEQRIAFEDRDVLLDDFLTNLEAE